MIRDEPSSHELLRRLEAAERQLAEQRQTTRPGTRPPPRPPLLRRFTLSLAAFAVALLPLALLATDPTFSDLGTAATVHQSDIRAIGNAGITTGIDDPTSEDPTVRLYNPHDPVTREQMASFLARTAGLGGNPPVANALTAVNVTQADRLDGFDAADLVYAARGGGTNFFGEIPSSGYLTAATVRFTAPGPGYVLLNASVNVGSTFATVSTLTLQGRLVDETANIAAPELRATIPQSTDYTVALSPTYLFSIPAAGERIYRLEVGRNAVSATSGGRFYYPTITALYIPFGTINNAPFGVSLP